MKIYELPDYYIANDINYSEYRNKAIEIGELFYLIHKWRFIFENSYDKTIKKHILANNFNHQRVLELIRHELKTQDGKIIQGIISKSKRVAVELICPTAIIQTALIAKKFGVPEYTALHQAFCREENHERCFLKTK